MAKDFKTMTVPPNLEVDAIQLWTTFGYELFGKSILNPLKIIERKYISENGVVNGFYSGITALNILGLSTQMANVTEICTNNETSKLRNVRVGNQSVVLRRSRTKINNDNVDVLQFLELMNQIRKGFFDDERCKTIRQWVTEHKISRKQISQYAPLFPDNTMRNLINILNSNSNSNGVN